MTKNDYEKLKLQRRKALIDVKIEALIIERENINRILSIIEAEKYTPRQFIANEVSQFLQDAGFEEASKAVDCEYEL